MAEAGCYLCRSKEIEGANRSFAASIKRRQRQNERRKAGGKEKREMCVCEIDVFRIERGERIERAAATNVDCESAKSGDGRQRIAESRADRLQEGRVSW